MRGSLSTHRSTCQGVKALAGRVLLTLLWVAAGAVLVALRVLLVLLLRVLRPFIIWPLLMACLGGMAATVGFAVSHMWADAMRAGFVTLTCALILGLYSAGMQAIDAGHFDQVASRLRRPWWSGGQTYDDAQ